MSEAYQNEEGMEKARAIAVPAVILGVGYFSREQDARS